MSYFNFPDQSIPEGDKNLEWHKSHILQFVSYTGSKHYVNRSKEIDKLYCAYAAQLDPETEKIIQKTITERCGQNFGPEYSVYPLIESKIDKLVGDYRKRPLKRKLLVTNQDAVVKKLDAKIDMISESLIRGANADMADALGFVPESENPQMEIPEDISMFFSKDYRTNSEEQGENILKHILVVRKEKEKFYEALKHYLIAGSVWTLLGEKDGHPTNIICSNQDVYYDYDPHETIQKDPQYFVYDKLMPLNDIYNTFDISQKDKEKLNVTKGVNNNSLYYTYEQGSLRVRVVSMMWKSRKKIKFKSFINAAGNDEYKVVNDGDRIQKRDKIETLEIEDIRHITMIGPDIVLSWGSLDKQMKSVANEKKRFIPVVGLVDYGILRNGQVRSLAKKLLYLQGFASEILYEIRLNMRQMDGNAMVLDLANIPKQWLADGPDTAVEKVNYYLKRDRIQIINSRDKRSNPYASSVNVSQKGRIAELMNLLSLIENLADNISGVKTQEQNPYQKATVAEIQYDSVSSRTEEYFGIFDTYTDIVNERMILKAKHVYEDGQVFNFFAGDTQMQFLQISSDFFVDDLGIYVVDNRKDYEDKQAVNEMAMRLFGNAQSPELMRDIIKIVKSDNVTEAEAILDQGIAALQKIKQENDQMLQQQQQAQIQSDQDIQKRQEDQKDLDRKNNIDVANIYANNKADENRVKVDGENLRKMAEIEKDLAIEANRNEKKDGNK